MKSQSTITKQVPKVKKPSTHKWADTNCKLCEGSGEVYPTIEDVADCICVRTNKADYRGEQQSDAERGN